MVTEEQHRVDLLAARGERVQVDVRVRAFEDAMLVPLRLADHDAVAGRLQVRHVRGLVARVGHLENDVDDRFRVKAGYRRRPNVVDAYGGLTESGRQLIAHPPELARPARSICDHLDRIVASATQQHSAPEIQFLVHVNHLSQSSDDSSLCIHGV